MILYVKEINKTIVLFLVQIKIANLIISTINIETTTVITSKKLNGDRIQVFMTWILSLTKQ
jgi:hypothetical protein